jgi:hypothetical protein
VQRHLRALGGRTTAKRSTRDARYCAAVAPLSVHPAH